MPSKNYISLNFEHCDIKIYIFRHIIENSDIVFENNDILFENSGILFENSDILFEVHIAIEKNYNLVATF